jgi:hypothetical protein
MHRQFRIHGRLVIALAILLIFTITEVSCATQKHRKIKAVPCPCETQNKR